MFRDFIYSPYFNKAVYVRNYFDKLKSFYPEFENYEKNKEAIFKSIYPDREYLDSTIRKLQSELLKLAEEFIIVSSLKNKEIFKSNLLLEELDKRKIDNLFLKKLNHAYISIEESEQKNERYFKSLHNLNNTEILFHSMRDRRKGFAKYYETIENLDKFYIIQKLKKITIIIGENRLYAKVFEDKKEIESFIKLIQKNKFFDFPVIQIFFNILMINWKGDREYYNNLKKLITVYKTEISREELEAIYLAMVNYCVVQSNVGNKEFTNEELDIYKRIIEDDFLLYNDTLESIIYKNIISCAVEAGDFDFASEFKNKYSKYILTNDKNDIVAYCEANIAYAGKNYSAAMEFLAKINFSEVNQKFSLRNLSLKIFYESEMYEQAISGIESYKQNLKRENTLPHEILKLYSTFIVFYKKLLKIKLYGNKDDARLLNKHIKKTDTMAKAWLLKQSAELL